MSEPMALPPFNYNYNSDPIYRQTSEMRMDGLRFRQQFRGDVATIRNGFKIVGSFMDLVEQFRSVVPSETLRLNLITGDDATLSNGRVFLTISDNIGTNLDPWESVRRDISITASGEPETVRKILKFSKTFPRMKNPSITWNYILEGKRNEAVVFVEEPRPTHDVFYPYIRPNLTEYYNSYLNSSASIILLRGEPGTGKTSFIQNLIWHSNMNAMITYEEKLFQSDEMFVAFMTDPSKNLLIMEDADLMLLSRERDGNQTMAKFLNVADGLIRFPNKKIIISSNLVEESRIDPALLRRGRCFDTPVFRKLTVGEATDAANAVNIEFNPLPTQKEYSLAEVLGGPEKKREGNIIGFRAR